MRYKTHLAKPSGDWTLCGQAVSYTYEVTTTKLPRVKDLLVVEADPTCRRCLRLSDLGRGLGRTPKAPLPPGVVGASAHLVQLKPGHYYFLPITVGEAFKEALYGATQNPLEATAFQEVWWLNDVLLPALRPHCPQVCVVRVEAELTITPVVT